MTTKKSKRTYNAPKGTKIIGFEMLNDGKVLLTFAEDDGERKDTPVFKVGDRVVLKSHNMIEDKVYNDFAYLECMSTDNGSYITIKEVDEFYGATIFGINNINHEEFYYPIEWLEHCDVEFKKGDILTAVGVGHDKSNMTFIYNHFDKYSGHFEALCGGVQINPATKKSQLRDTWFKYGFNKDKVRHATPSEIEQFDNDLKSIGKKWNRDTLEIEDIVPEFKRGDIVIHDNTKRVSIFDEYVNSRKDFKAITSMMNISNGTYIDVTFNKQWNTDTLRMATDDEAKLLFDLLKSIGKKWNRDTLEIEDIVDEFKRGDILASDNALLIFDKYEMFNQEKDLFHSLWNNFVKDNRYWQTKAFIHAADEQKAQLHKELREEGKRWNAEKLEIENLDTPDIVIDWITACEYLNKPMPKNYIYEPNSDFEKQINAQIKLQMVREAWNKHDEFVVDYANSEQDKYFPVLDVYGCIRCFISWDTPHVSVFGLSFPTKERAIQFGNQFKELFKTAMGIE